MTNKKRRGRDQTGDGGEGYEGFIGLSNPNYRAARELLGPPFLYSVKSATILSSKCTVSATNITTLINNAQSALDKVIISGHTHC